MKYLKRRGGIEAVEAVQFTLDTVGVAREFCGGTLYDRSPAPPWIIFRSEGRMSRVDLGDWIIKDILGKITLCTDSEFETLYAEEYAPGTLDAETVERLFCAAVLAEGTDITQRVLGRYLEYKGNPEKILKQLGVACAAALRGGG